MSQINENSNLPAPEETWRADKTVKSSQPATGIPFVRTIPNATCRDNTPIIDRRPANINTIIKLGEGIKLSPDRLLRSSFVMSPDATFPSRSTTRMPSALPTWLWYLLSFGLGISRDKPLTKIQKCVSFTLRILTIVTALCFGICGLVMNIHEALNEYTQNTALVCLFKSAVGMFWVLLGLYSHSLAVRSFSSKGLLDYIRLHAKTFMKISTTIWITLLCVSVTVANFYSNRYLLEDKTPEDDNETDIIDPTCGELDINVALCQVYFYSKVISSCFNLIWILAVSAVCLSVCRTHAICMRRFIRELAYDSKIFEEFSKLKLCQQEQQLERSQGSFAEYDSHHDENLWSKSVDLEPTSNTKKVWDSLRKIRNSGLLGQTESMNRKDDVHFSDLDEQDKKEPQIDLDVLNETGDSRRNQEIESENSDPCLKGQEENFISDLSAMTAPILSNADLMFTYFKIMKHLSTTSRLLQRWMSSSIIFVAMWCILLVIYWTSNAVKLIDVFQFLTPLTVLGLLISAYAEVNYEGYLLPKYILPTEDRISVLYYVNNRPLELKVYSFTLTFNILATFVAGIALTFASQIVIRKI